MIIQNDVLLIKKIGGNNEAITSVCRDVQFLISYRHTEGSTVVSVVGFLQKFTDPDCKAKKYVHHIKIPIFTHFILLRDQR